MGGGASRLLRKRRTRLFELRRALAPALQERKGGAPAARLLELGFAFLSKPLQLVDRHYG
jgi:hypothetical protein